MSVMQQFNRILGERMAASGRMAMIETTGRSSGRRFRTPVGYVANADGSLWLGAGRPESHWPKNLLASPACRIRIKGSELDYVAEPLAGAERERAIEAIHSKYGAPASMVGNGPVFVVRPVEATAAAPAPDADEADEAVA